MTVSAAVLSWLVVAVLEGAGPAGEWRAADIFTWLVLGALYTHFVEYWYHRVPMHKGLRHFRNVKWNHLVHHRVFHGERFKTQDPKAMEHIAGRWHVFPLLFFGHYLVFHWVLRPVSLTAFLGGVVLHYVTFELTHWFTHVEDNAFDRWISRVPVLNRIREIQIFHHWIHHETPDVAFNFNPPFLGDLVMGNLPRYVEPAPAPWASPWWALLSWPTGACRGVMRWSTRAPPSRSAFVSEGPGARPHVSRARGPGAAVRRTQQQTWDRLVETKGQTFGLYLGNTEATRRHPSVLASP